MVKPPGSLPEGAVERSETEGVYFGERKRLKFSEPTMAYGYPLARSNQRTTLPQSRPCGRASSLREGAGKGGTIYPTARKPQDFGRFSSPLRKLGRVYFLPFIGRHSLSHALWACQLPQRGSREGLYHSPDRPEAARFRAIFIAPTKLKRGYILPSIRLPGNRKVTGDFHRPYESARGTAAK